MMKAVALIALSLALEVGFLMHTATVAATGERAVPAAAVAPAVARAPAPCAPCVGG